MKSLNLADKVLAGVCLAFGASLLVKINCKDSLAVRMAFSVLEAAVVGGFADWFAVTALFRKPLGFPYHTELIPRNRAKLIGATTLLVQNDFFNKDKLLASVERLPLLAHLIAWVENGKGKYVLLALLRKAINQFFAKLDPKRAAAGVERLLKAEIVRFNLTPFIQQQAKTLVEQGQHQKIVDASAAALLELLQQASTRRRIIDYCVQSYQEEKAANHILLRGLKWLGEQMGQIDPEELGAELHAQAVRFMKEIEGDKNHPLRGWVKQKLLEVAEALDKDAKTCAAIEAWKNAVVREAHFSAALEELLEILTAQVLAPATGQAKGANEAVTAWIIDQFVCYWEAFKRNEEVCRSVEQALKQIVIHLIEHEHAIIGAVVTLAMEKLTDAGLNKLIEERVGTDLQFIRINGSLVGGCIGLALFAAGELVRRF